MKNKSTSKVWGRRKRGEKRPKKNDKGFYLDTTFTGAIEALLQPTKKPAKAKKD